jgi:hypothetical protein
MRPRRRRPPRRSFAAGPQDATRDALDDVAAVDERAAVHEEEPHAGRGRDPRRRRVAGPGPRARVLAALAGPVDLDRAGDHAREDAEQRFVLLVEGHGRVARGRQHPGELAQHHRRRRELALGRREPSRRGAARGVRRSLGAHRLGARAVALAALAARLGIV